MSSRPARLQTKTLSQKRKKGRKKKRKEGRKENKEGKEKGREEGRERKSHYSKIRRIERNVSERYRIIILKEKKNNYCLKFYFIA